MANKILARACRLATGFPLNLHPPAASSAASRGLPRLQRLQARPNTGERVHPSRSVNKLGSSPTTSPELGSAELTDSRGQTIRAITPTQAELDEKLRVKMAGLAGDGGEAGVELEDGKPVAMKRSVRENMFRYI